MTPIAVVTGASSGIGAATAIALGRHGYRIVVGARRVERLARVAGEEGVAMRLDVTD
jgi:NADP-dependent 3-hydroxy acid dehydrogenase YdfG